MQDFRTWLQQGELAGQSYRLASPRRSLKGAAGFHAGSQNGVSLDFSDYREYHPGDDIRSLDWNVFGRTDRLTIKLYHEEVAPHVDIVLDASRSMGLVESKPQALLGIGALLATAAAGGNYSWNAFRLGARLASLDRRLNEAAVNGNSVLFAHAVGRHENHFPVHLYTAGSDYFLHFSSRSQPAHGQVPVQSYPFIHGRSSPSPPIWPSSVSPAAPFRFFSSGGGASS